MLELVACGILAVIGWTTKDPLYLMASGLFAIAAQIFFKD